MSNSMAGALKQHDKELDLVLGDTIEPVEEQVGCLGACTGHERGMRGQTAAEWHIWAQLSVLVCGRLAEEQVL